MLRVVFWFFLGVISSLGHDGFNKLLNLNSILVFIGVEDVIEGALDEFGVDVDAFKVCHVLFIEEIPGFRFGKEAV